MDDIVVEVDRWLALPASLREATVSHALLQATRDNIMSLRTQLEAVRDIAGNERKLSEVIIQQARDAALEEAAQRCDSLATDYTIPVSADKWSAGCRGCAGRIRALKE